MTLKCSDFVKNCMGGLYCIANLLGVGRKKSIYGCYGFYLTPSKPK